MNEEDIRGKLILPYLKDLGIDISEISLETQFSIQIGKTMHKIRGRSDILCKRHEKNLFIIELKNDSRLITQNDINQGISYARSLLDDIAPFTIISNGKTTKIFDSISRKELSGTNICEQSDFWKNGYTLSTEEEIRIRYEALKNFISLSPTNLKSFCKSQIQDRMGQIIGDIDSPYSKFVKELHVQRKYVHKAFNDFLKSPNSVFGLVGSAGVGKTSAICSLALKHLDDKFVFFYNAAIIKSPLKCISQDLNIVFSSRSETDIVLKKLNELGRYANKNIIIFIDAIDESTNPDISIELSEIALVLKHLDKVKIILSCKTNLWETLLKINGNPTHLFEELSKYHNQVKELSGCPGLLLKDFTSYELDEIFPLYQKAYGFKGTISNSISNDLRNGFFLRIFSEVYRNRYVPERINDKELIQKYLRQSLKKSSIKELIGYRILAKIGNILLNYDYSSHEAYLDEGLDSDNLIENLDFSLHDNIPEDLFSRNILIKSNKEDSYNISFYYSKIRDYIICYHTYKLDKLNNDKFYSVLGDFYQNYIGKSALDFYLENACSSHINTLIEYKKHKALKYVVDYENYIDENFKNLKETFDPKTKHEIGILLPNDLINEDGYALIPLQLNVGKRLQFQSLEEAFNRTDGKNLFFDRGVQIVYSSNSEILVSNQENTLKKNIFEQLKKTLENGGLCLYNSDIILLEKLCSILYIYHEKLNYEYVIEDFYLPRMNLIYPINLKDLKARLYKFNAAQYFRRKNVDRNLINAKVQEAFEKKLSIPNLNVRGDVPPFEELFKIVEILLERGHNIINEHHLPCPNKSLQEVKELTKKNNKEKRNFDIREIRNYQFDEQNARVYIEKFFKYLELAYKDFVEYFFPTLKHKFTFYNSIPHEYFFYMKDCDILKWGTYGYREAACGEMKVYIKKSEPLNENAFSVDRVKTLKHFSLERVLFINDWIKYPVKTVAGINSKNVDELCVLWNWIFKILEDDMESIFEYYDV